MPLITRIAAVFASGAVAGAFLPPSIVLILSFILLALAALYCSAGREGLVLLAAAASAVGYGLADRASTPSCPHYEDGAPVIADGVLEGTPTDAKRSISLKLATGQPCSGRMRVRVPDNAAPLVMGDRVNVRGTWMILRIGSRADPLADGMLLASAVVTNSNIEPHALLRARSRAQGRIHELFPTTYPLAEALLIAQRENLDPEVRERFAASGLTHLLAISGTHVALVAATLLLLARLLRMSRGLAAVISLVGSAAYVFFLGAPFAALRALLQMSLLLLSRNLQRPAHPLGLLAVAAIAITIIDPRAPLDAGFQLSFAGICGIVLWRRPLIELQPASLPVALRDAIATTCAATAATTPIAAAHFGVISVISLAANLLAIPVVTIAVPTAAAALALSAVSSAGARFIAGGAELSMLWLNDIARRCAAVPGGHFTATPSAVVIGTAATLVVFVALRGRFRSTLRGRVVTAVMAGALPIVVAPLLPLSKRALEIHMIDVGQGDAFAIRSPRGRWVLVDAGPKSEKFDAGKNTIAPYLLRRQAAELVAVFLSHPHLDHFGGFAAVADRLTVRAVFDPAMPVRSFAFDSVLAVAERQRIPWYAVRPGGSLVVDGMRIDFIGPAYAPVDARADPNDYSAAFRLEYGSFTALFLGDMPIAVENELVRRHGDELDVDLLKVAHHGSGGSSGDELLSATSPSVALISAGRRNRYGHPHPRALARLVASGARIFSTERDGSVVVAIDADGRMTVQLAQ